MSDLISRQDAIDALGEEPEVWSGNDEYAQGLNNQWHYDINALKALPSAQKKGKWIVQDGAVRCSECGEPNMEWNYCPNCGADMRRNNDE